MPHQCTECGHTFEDGSKEMLSGCPECGGNKFQFLPAGATGSSTAPDSTSKPDPASPSTPPSASDSSNPSSAFDSTSSPEESPPAEPTESLDSPRNREDSAQADARSAVVENDELPANEPVGEEEEGKRDTEKTPDLSQLREELNDQFESIRIVDHGQYELNLMELYKREEFIIALQENGRYVIEVPESFRRGPDS